MCMISSRSERKASEQADRHISGSTPVCHEQGNKNEGEAKEALLETQKKESISRKYFLLFLAWAVVQYLAGDICSRQKYIISGIFGLEVWKQY
jgi:hypothetical protein